MFYQVTEDLNHNKQLTCLAGQVPGNGCPLGSIMPYYGTTMPSRNWLLCDGSTFDADEYPALYEFLGSNTLPDLRGEFLRGAGTNGHSGQGNGGVVGEHQDATTIHDIGANSSGNLLTPYSNNHMVLNGEKSVAEGNSFTYPNDKNYYGQATRYAVRPTNTSVNWIIKATSSIDTETSDNVYATIHEEDKYKTTEVNTGKTWIDGKPIYRKCISGSQLVYQGQTDLLTGVESLTYFHIMVKRTNGSDAPYVEPYSISSTDLLQIIPFVSTVTDGSHTKGDLYVYSNWSTFSYGDWYAIVEYTKLN